MKPKIIAILGLVCLSTSQILMTNGFDFLQSQRPVDFAHWLMLIGAVCLTAFCFVFPKSIFSRIATPLIILGAIAHVGMCAIDFVLWSFGEDYEGRNQLIGQLINTPVIWLPFMVIGPALLYTGLSLFGWAYVKRYTLYSILVLLGTSAVGIGQMVLRSPEVVAIGCVVFSIGLAMLANKVGE